MSFDLGWTRTKEEGKPILYGDREEGFVPDPTSYMELRLRHTLTRAEVHQLVEEWLEEAKWPN